MPTASQQDTAIVVLNRDDKDVRLIRSLLEKLGLKVLSSSNLNDALDLFSAAGETARLLIIDEAVSPASMPGFLECVRSLNPGIRILLISERDESEPAQSWVAQASIRGFLRRPFRRAKFLGSVLQLIGEPLVRTA